MTSIDFGDLLQKVPQVGRLESIGVSPGKKEPIEQLETATLKVGTGIEGDHHCVNRPGGHRQVTLIQAEHLPVVAQLCGRDAVSPEQLRRNLVVSGINLLSLKKSTFTIGDVLLEGTGPCDPCRRMEENLGEGGFQAMRGHGGITAKVLTGGTIRLGDPITLVCAE
ncbi:MOSC domain protein [Thalassoglobus neptunius]|uniref:MOSC domain protein n=1 Tax=Thalassoglobus neptunius TaxID=1938619 RepID=A0A5C5WQG1_9PLAN|nr:MOSC domain-containing protein [Thalassoglobus neptunius]TWT52331.1 MOSC domain protein [Thalassoglobus neptunius]